MRYKLFAFVLALTIASWAQTSTPSQAPDSGKTSATDNAGVGCCSKMGSADHASKDGHSCMQHEASTKDGKEAASCCSGKDAASCCGEKDGKSCAQDDKSSASSSQNKCGKDHEMGCCAGKDSKTTAQNHCGGGQDKHDHHDPAAPGTNN